MTTDYIETQMDNIAKLEDNWNDNGAPAFSNEMIEKARAMAYLLGKSEIIPTAIGSIQFEIENAYGYLIIELFKDGDIETYFEKGN